MTEPHPLPAPGPDGPFPQDFGRSRLDGRIGGGSHGTVYRAFETIVDSPRRGTLLTADEIERAFLEYGRCREGPEPL